MLLSLEAVKKTLSMVRRFDSLTALFPFFEAARDSCALKLKIFGHALPTAHSTEPPIGSVSRSASPRAHQHIEAGAAAQCGRKI